MIRLAKYFAFIFLIISCSLQAGESDSRRAKEIKPKRIIKLANAMSRQLKEISGFTRSSRDPNLLWTITDSDTPNNLYAINLEGKIVATLRVEKARNVDWEAIDSFELNQQAYLMIADIGDNHGERDYCTLYIVREPTLGGNDNHKISVDWLVHFRYEDGAKDSESIAVDVDLQKVIVISKRTSPPFVYELPLQPANDIRYPAIAKLSAELNGMLKPSLREFLFGGNALRFSGQPTDLAISPDRTIAAVLTYTGIFQYQRDLGETWPQALSKAPFYMPIPDVPQAESVEWSADGNSLFVSTEQNEPPLYQIELR